MRRSRAKAPTTCPQVARRPTRRCSGRPRRSLRSLSRSPLNAPIVRRQRATTTSTSMNTRTASCSCGQLTATTTEDPIRVGICHCLACQRRTGSVFGAQARFPAIASKSRASRRSTYASATKALDQFLTFIAAVDEGSFSAAGRKLRRAQSVVSQTLANLEAQLGVKLFDRSARYPKLTEEGRSLLADARSVAENVDEFKARARAMREASSPSSPLRWM